MGLMAKRMPGWFEAVGRSAKKEAPDNSGAFYWCARQGTLTWRWKSSMDPAAGTISRTARVSVVRLNLKEAAGKTLARRIGIAYEAVMSDEKANSFKVQ